NIGNTRPDRVKGNIDASNAMLEHSLQWSSLDALVFLATEFYPKDGSQPRIVGSAKVQRMFDHCWEKRLLAKRPNRGAYRAETEWLCYSDKESDAAEMAGNAVLPMYREAGIGRFQVQARILFVLIHG